jgi:hypothetical protein
MQPTMQLNTTSTEPKPQSMLLLQSSMLDSRVFPVYSLQDALDSTQ